MSFRSESRSSSANPVLLALLATLSLHGLGCGPGTESQSGTAPPDAIGSSGIATEDLDAFIGISSSTPGQVHVGASLERETIFDIEDVVPSGGDSFRASLNGRAQTLQRTPGSSSTRSTTVLETSPAQGEVRVRFRREDLSVPLRPEFTVTSPAPGVVLGFQDDLELAWTPAEPGHVMRIWLSRSCRTLTGGNGGGSFYLQVVDSGAFTYELSHLPEATNPNIDTSQDCNLSLRFEREASSDIVPPFAPGSRMESLQIRTVPDVILTF